MNVYAHRPDGSLMKATAANCGNNDVKLLIVEMTKLYNNECRRSPGAIMVVIK